MDTSNTSNSADRAFPSFAERRRFPRHSATRNCRLFRPSFNAFGSGQTCDYSAGGALLDIASARPLQVGETVDVLIEFKLSGVLSSQRGVRSTIIRADNTGIGMQRIAVKFDVALASMAA
jgi:hypothetical protein